MLYHKIPEFAIISLYYAYHLPPPQQPWGQEDKQLDSPRLKPNRGKMIRSWSTIELDTGKGNGNYRCRDDWVYIGLNSDQTNPQIMIQVRSSTALRRVEF